VRITLLGGFVIEHGSERVVVTGAGQRALLFRLALDAPAAVAYRDLAEDLWPDDPPVNTKAALQSIVSRLRTQLPPESIESEPGGYRLQLQRRDVDILHFQDLVAAASAEKAESAELATQALALWGGDPWLPGEQFAWLREQLQEDRSLALELGGRFSLDDPVGSAPPAPMTGIVGREPELRAVVSQLEANRLVTIIGTGGAGKTRLAVEAAGLLQPSLVVELAPVGRNELWQAILAGVGRQVRSADGAQESLAPRERVLEALTGRRLTLVLDNCEHVIDAAASVVTELLTGLAELRILATSREPLGLLGESFVTLGPLGHPQGGELQHELDEAAWAGYPALELFDRRAAAARGRPIAVEEFSDAARLVSRLDGLPLALELAAAKLRTMTVAEVADGLDDRFALLGRGARGSVPRHQTLRALIDWSWGLLSGREQRALAWLSVYPAGIPTRNAAAFASACAAADAAVADDVLDVLVDKSLVQRVAGRFRMLETIREYGIERLGAAGETEQALTALATAIADGVESHDPLLRTGATLEAIVWFDSEEDNIWAALRYAIDARLGELACRIVAGCCWYWVIRDRFSDALPWVVATSALAHEVHSEIGSLLRVAGPLIEHFIAGPAGGDRAVLGALLESALHDFEAERLTASGPAGDLVQLAPVVLGALSGVVASGSGPGDVAVPEGEELGLSAWPSAMLHLVRAATAQNNGEAEVLGVASETAVRLFEELGDVWGLALSRQMRSEWLTLEGRLDEAIEVSRASTEGLRRITSTWDLNHQQGLVVTILCRQGKWEEGEELVTRLLDEGAAGGFRAGLMSNLTAAAFWIARGDSRRAEAHLERAEESFRELPGRVPQLSAHADIVRADVAIARGDADSAAEHLRSAADSAIASGDHPVIAHVAVTIGILALERGDPGEARRALDLATVIRGSRDATDLKVRRIEAAVGGTGRAAAVASTRPAAIEQLGELLQPGQILRR
jgi:predicted ATPase